VAAGGAAGQALGQAVSGGVGGAAQALIPTALQQAVAAAAAGGQVPGQRIGENVATGLGLAVGQRFPALVNVALQQSEGAGQQSGQRIGDGVAAGAEQGFAQINGLSSTLGSFADKELTLMRGVSTGVSNVLAFAFYGILIYGASKRDILQRDFNYSLISAVVYALLQQASVYQYTAVTPLANLAQSLLVGHNLYRIKMFTPITALFKKK
jgi:hypothetical protein